MAASTAERLKMELEKEILLFRLRPGDRLDETGLAQRYGTSRTPVREALRQLAASGLVEIKPHRGAEVSRLSIPQLLEMFELMSVLEGACGRFAAERASDEELMHIRKAHEACREYVDTKDPDGYYFANVHFHEAIYRASQNRLLAEKTLHLRNRLAPYRRFQLRRNNRPADSYAEHEEIVEAITAGDPARAERLLQKHIAVQGGHITTLIANLPPEYLSQTPWPVGAES